MNMKKRIAVVIPNWNGEDFLGQCLEALQNQTIEHTVFVVDNGSIDNSKEIIENSQATGIYLDQNYGFAGGVNRGIEPAMKAGFEYILLLNNDAKPAPDAVEKLFQRISGDDKIGIVTCKLLTSDGKKLDSTGDFYSTWGLPYPRGRGSTDINAYDESVEIFGASGGASMYRAKLFEDIGLFDEDFFAYYEDVDLSFRAQLRGWNIVFEPKSEIYHVIGGTSRKLVGFSTYQSFKNLPWLLIKNVPSNMLMSVGFKFMLARFFFFASAIFKGEVLYAIKGDWEATKGLSKKRRERKEIQSRATVDSKVIMNMVYQGIPPNYLRLRSVIDKVQRKSTPPINERRVVAIDLRALDGASRYRGIGMVIFGLLKYLLPLLLKKFTVFIYIHNPANLEQLNQKDLRRCEVIQVPQKAQKFIPEIFYKHLRNLYPNLWRSNKLPRLNEVDAFYQPYVDLGLPRKKKVKTVLTAHDIIPLIYESHYYDTVGLGRGPKGQFHRILRQMQKMNYKNGLKSFKNADSVVSVSEYTKGTLTEYLGVKPSLIQVVYNGVPEPNKKSTPLPNQYTQKPYVIYVGGIDYRRDLKTLVEAFERIRKTHDWNLYLAGRDFENLDILPIGEVFKNSSEAKNIHVLGYVSEELKIALLKGAVAQIYPTLHEGFGLPIVEGLRDGCPVITYQNSSTKEAGGDAAIYAESSDKIAKYAIKLNDDAVYRKKVIEKGLVHYKKFSWKDAAYDYEKIIEDLIGPA
jgi:GT2 family glycosyltransferase/glycosyltransferase involved in cell wall biosynthesis